LGAWYWIGVATGLGAAFGVLGQGVIRDVRIVLPIAIAAGLGGGYLLAEWAGSVGGIAGGALAGRSSMQWSTSD
jgi:hypothetical protein